MRLAIQVVGDVRSAPVMPTASEGFSLAIKAARYNPAGHPSVRSSTSARCSVVSSTCASAKICRAPACVEGQVIGSEFQHLTRHPEPRDVRLLLATRRDQLRSRGMPATTTLNTSWQAGDRSACRSSSIRTNGSGAGSEARRRVAALPVPGRRRRTRAYRRSASGPGRPARRPMPGRTGAPPDRRRRCRATPRRPERSSRVGPFRQEGRLAVARRRRHRDDGMSACPAGADQGASAHCPLTVGWDRELRLEQRPIEGADRGKRGLRFSIAVNPKPCGGLAIPWPRIIHSA